MSYCAYPPSGYRTPQVVAPPLTPVVKGLLVANAVCFVVQHLAGYRFTFFFGLIPALVVSKLYLWQFATYMFLHGGLLHILFNMLVLYLFGREVEAALGSKPFAAFYFFCGIGAGLCSFVFYYSPSTPVIGASGAIFGILIAFGMLFPERIVTLLVAFVLPVSMKAKHLVMVFLGIEILLIASNARSDIAHFAHLGGAVCGYLYIRNFAKIRSWLGSRTVKERRPRSDGRADDKLRGEVDAILEKISRHGLSSLTDAEKEFLRRAKDRY